MLSLSCYVIVIMLHVMLCFSIEVVPVNGIDSFAPCLIPILYMYLVDVNLFSFHLIIIKLLPVFTLAIIMRLLTSLLNVFC